MNNHDSKDHCCGRGGARPGCGRKPGVKTRPVRLPEWMLDALEEKGDVRKSIIQACIAYHKLDCPTQEEEGSHDQS
jgi:hypothetical protein